MCAGGRLTDILRCLDTSELHEGFAGAVQGFGDGGSGFGFTLGADNGCLSFLFGLRERLISDGCKWDRGVRMIDFLVDRPESPCRGTTP